MGSKHPITNTQTSVILTILSLLKLTPITLLLTITNTPHIHIIGRD